MLGRNIAINRRKVTVLLTSVLRSIADLKTSGPVFPYTEIEDLSHCAQH